MEIETEIDKVSLKDDEYGKEIFLLIKSLEIHNEDEFYTDLNGLHAKKRSMEAFDSADYASYSNNFYPVTSFAFIEDLNTDIRMT